MSASNDPQIYLNGQYCPLSEACISVMDRGFLLGDAVYEVVPVFYRVPFRLEHHLDRLTDSLNAIRMQNPLDHKQWTAIIDKLGEQFDDDNQSIYIQVTRGISAARDHIFPSEIKPTVFVMCKPVNMSTVPDPYQGISAITVDDIRWQYCNVKATTLLANVLARQTAIEQDAAEAIMVRDGYAIEGAASNLFIVIDGIIITPPKSQKLLPGITRDVILELADNDKLPCQERDISIDELVGADEVWLTSSVREVVPVVKLNNKPVADGQAGKHWKHMKKLYEAFKKSLAP